MPNVSLTPQMQDFINAKVASGTYANASEVMRAGVRRLMEEDTAALEALRADLKARRDGPFVEVDLRDVLLGKED